MSSAQSNSPRLAMKQENSFHMEIIQLIETEVDQLLDLKYKDMSTIIMKKFKVLMENLDLMVEEVRESLKNDLKEILGVKSAIPEMINTENSSTRSEWPQQPGTALLKTGLVEKTEGENNVEGVGNLTLKRKEMIQLGSKLDKAKEHNTSLGHELFQNESQNHNVMGSVEEVTGGNVDDTGRSCSIHIEVTGEGKEHGQDVLLKEMREKNIPQNFKIKEKILKASKEDGEILTLAADFSSATLDISKQWSNVFNILRENDFEPKILCQVKLAFKCDGKIWTFSDMQSLSKFISQKSFMKELLKGVLPEIEKVKKEGRRYGIQKKVDENLIVSKHGAGGAISDVLSFLFTKEVKFAEPEEIKNSVIHNKEASEWKAKKAQEERKETLGLKQEASELEEEEETTELEEEGEETSGLEEEETSELDEAERVSDLEKKEEASILGKEQHSTFQSCSAVVNTKHGVEVTTDELEDVLAKEIEEYEREEEDLEQKLEVFLPLEEGEDFEVEKIETTFQAEEKEASRRLKEIGCSYFSSDSEKKNLVKHELTSKETDLIQETGENFRRNVINNFREIQEELGNIKNYHPGNKEISVLETKLEVDTLRGRIDTLEERMNNLEDRIDEFSKDIMEIAKQVVIKERIRDIEDRSRSLNIRLIGVPEKYNNENGAEDIIKEIIEENFADINEDSSLEIVSAHRVPSKIDEKRLTPRHILVKFGNCNDKEKILNASREKKEITYRGIRIRLTADLSLDTLDARSQWGNIISVLQAKGFNPRILYPAKLAFVFEGKTKIFFDTEDFRKFVSRIPFLKEFLEDAF